MATRTLASCKLGLDQVEPTLRLHGLLLGAGALDCLVRKPGVLRTDSRKIEVGDIFLAYKGVSSDGHEHLAKAKGAGAALVVVEQEGLVPAGMPWIKVTNGRAAWARLAAEAFGNPQDKLTVLGVTGTNGKTSTAWMTGELLRAHGSPALVVGTLGAFLGAEKLPTTHTTPDPDVLYALFALALDQGVKVVAMEVSSHAIAQEKLGPIGFSGCAFTSFSRDHLDFHGTMAAYWAEKWRFFQELARPDAALAFADVLTEPINLKSLRKFQGESVVYGFDAERRRKDWGATASLLLTAEQTSIQGTTLRATFGKTDLRGSVPYFAKHALENFGAALLLARKALGTLPEPKLWSALRPVPGRLEQIVGPGGPAVIVDYAHTPDALEKTLEVVRPLTRGKISVVFGCGGDRDRGKRPLMGKIAATLADAVYVTSDNPRSEDPEDIARQIAAGVPKTAALVVEVDRGKAIERAVEAAKMGDLVVVAGKGHETYQIFKDRTVHFDDREVAARVLSKKAGK